MRDVGGGVKDRDVVMVRAAWFALATSCAGMKAGASPSVSDKHSELKRKGRPKGRPVLER
jgi:hypothetical protein